MKLNLYLLLICFVMAAHSLFAQTDTLLLSGPMPGYNTDSKATLWVQLRDTAHVQYVYWPEGSYEFRDTTDAIFAKADKGHTTIHTLTRLLPDTKYRYRLLIDSQRVALPVDSVFYTQPILGETFDFRMASGSCSYITDEQYKSDRGLFRWGRKFDMFERIADAEADYMLWLGDNIYLRHEEWESKDKIYARYTHTRSHPDIQRLLATTHHIATWDDHDYGPNNSDKTYKLKEVTRQAFMEFWPHPPQDHNHGGIFTNYKIGDVEIFLMDDRYFRDPESIPGDSIKDFLGKKQVRWLIQSLKSSTATFKLIAIGTQVLTTAGYGEAYEDQAQREWKSLMNDITRSKVEGIVFLSGDKHFSEITKMETEGFYPLYDITISPITSLPNPFFKLRNKRRIKGTRYSKRNFAVFSFEGKPENRTMKIELYNRKGKEKWDWELKASDLTIPPRQVKRNTSNQQEKNKTNKKDGQKEKDKKKK